MTDTLKPTQADRDAAAAVFRQMGQPVSHLAASVGLADDSPLVLAFARHRLSHTSDREALIEALEQIVQWADAYPLNIFPEPDFEVCARVLKDAGQTLDAVSASNMRHVVDGVGKIARTALSRNNSNG